ncbi:MAG: 50S ribosomal protein L19 [Patescibacteria group bacterium]
MNQKLISFNLKQRKASGIAELQAGDVVKISRKIKEGGKERLQAFQGTVIAINGGQSSSKTITVRKISFGVGVELVLPLSSPQIEKIEFVKRTRARRAKLYYVRTKSGKDLSKKLKEIAVKGGLVEEVPAEAEVTGAVQAASDTTEKTEA